MEDKGMWGYPERTLKLEACFEIYDNMGIHEVACAVVKCTEEVIRQEKEYFNEVDIDRSYDLVVETYPELSAGRVFRMIVLNDRAARERTLQRIPDKEQEFMVPRAGSMTVKEIKGGK